MAGFLMRSDVFPFFNLATRRGCDRGSYGAAWNAVTTKNLREKKIELIHIWPQ